jgi:hypothetical protein
MANRDGAACKTEGSADDLRLTKQFTKSTGDVVYLLTDMERAVHQTYW